MKKWLIYGLVLAVFFIIFSWWFFSLSAIPAEADSKIVLKVLEGSVQIRSKDEDWHNVDKETELKENAEVKTADSGRATIRFFDKAETRLDGDSQLKILTAHQESGSAGSLAIELSLENGRVWSRVTSFQDLKSEFLIRAQSILATVQGTAFDFGLNASGTTLIVADSAVQLEVGSKLIIVPQEKMITVGKDGQAQEVKAISETALKSDWFKKNILADTAMMDEIKNQIRARQKSGSFEGLTNYSEKLRLRLAKDRKFELYGAFLGKKLLRINDLIAGGKSGLGLQALAGVENDVKDRLKSKDADRYLPALRANMADSLLLLKDVEPSSSLYRFNQRLEDLNQLFAGEDAELKINSRLLAIDSRLSLASSLIKSFALEEAGFSLDGAKQGIENVSRDLEQASSLSTIGLLRNKLMACQAREVVIREMLVSVLAPAENLANIEIATSTAMATSTESIAPEATSTADIPKEIASEPIISLSKLDLLPQGSIIIDQGQALQIVVKATYSNGKTSLVSLQTAWSSSDPKIGSVADGLFTATRNKKGQVTITGTFSEYGIAKSSSLTLTVQ